MLKTLVYAQIINMKEELWQWIQNVYQTVQVMPGHFKLIRQSLMCRAQLCIEMTGDHFQDLL
jgi:hypothetical protein